MLRLNLIAIIFLMSACFTRAQHFTDSSDFNNINIKPLSLYETQYLMSNISSMTAKGLTTYNPLESKINYNRLLLFGGVALGVGTVVHIYQSNAWWQEQSSKFRIVNDWNYALWIDKVGHFFGTHLLAHAFSGAYDAAQIQAEESAVLSAVSALAFELFIEIEDGFGPDWGFSPGDALFDVLGSGFYVSQYYYPFLKNIQPKISYYPSEEFREGRHKSGIIIDDYEGQIYWMGIRVKNILPYQMAKYWPSYLMISVGMGVSDLDGKGNGIREFYVSLDLDTEQIPLYGGFWQFVKNTLNYIHFPMPGIRITPKTAFFAVVF